MGVGLDCTRTAPVAGIWRHAALAAPAREPGCFRRRTDLPGAMLLGTNPFLDHRTAGIVSVRGLCHCRAVLGRGISTRLPLGGADRLPRILDGARVRHRPRLSARELWRARLRRGCVSSRNSDSGSLRRPCRDLPALPLGECRRAAAAASLDSGLRRSCGVCGGTGFRVSAARRTSGCARLGGRAL